MATKTVGTLLIILVSILLFPVAFGILAGVFGIVFGALAAVFGAVFGILGGIVGAIFGFFGWIFDGIFDWDFDYGFFDFNPVTIVLVILVVALLTRNKSSKQNYTKR
jgi:hypothetical protein